MSFELQGLDTTAAHTLCRLLLPILGDLPRLQGYQGFTVWDMGGPVYVALAQLLYSCATDYEQNCIKI